MDITNQWHANKLGYFPGIGIETILSDHLSLRAQYTHTLFSSFDYTTKATLNYPDIIHPEPERSDVYYYYIRETTPKKLTTKITPNRDMFSLILSWYFN